MPSYCAGLVIVERITIFSKKNGYEKNVLFILAFCVYALLLNAQSNSQDNLTPTKKYYFSKSSGFSWYWLQKGQLYGVMNLNGKIIVPIEYSNIEYKTGWVRSTNDMETHFFKVYKGNSVGAYSFSGKCYISTDKQYNDIILDGVYPILSAEGYHKGKGSWGYKKGESWGLLDINGNEVISSDNNFSIAFLSCFKKYADHPHNPYYINVEFL